MRGIARTSGISRQTLSTWLKKAGMTPTLSATLVEPQVSEKVELELDELYSFVRGKANKLWVRLAVCTHTK